MYIYIYTDIHTYIYMCICLYVCIYTYMFLVPLAPVTCELLRIHFAILQVLPPPRQWACRDCLLEGSADSADILSRLSNLLTVCIVTVADGAYRDAHAESIFSSSAVHKCHAVVPGKNFFACGGHQLRGFFVTKRGQGFLLKGSIRITIRATISV